MIIICKKLLKYYDEELEVSPERLDLLISEKAIEPKYKWKSCLFQDVDVAFVEELLEEDDIPPAINCCYLHLRNGDSFIINVSWKDFIDFIKPNNSMVHEFKDKFSKPKVRQASPPLSIQDPISDLCDNPTI